MKMKLTFLTTLILLVSFACTSYDAFMTEYDNVSKETAQIIDKEPNKGGLDKADEYLKAQTVMLKKKLAETTSCEVLKEQKKKYSPLLDTTSARFSDLGNKHTAISKEIGRFRTRMMVILVEHYRSADNSQ